MQGDMTGLENSVGTVKAKADGLGATFMRNSTVIGAGMTAAGAVISGSLALAVNNWAEYGDTIGKMAKRTGLGSEELSKLAFAAGQTGTSVESVEVGIRRMAKGLTDASLKGTGPAKDAMDALGLSVEEFDGLNPSQAFSKFAEAIRKVPDPIRKSALAQDIFGKSGTALLPLIAEGAAGLKAYGEEAEKLGIVMDDKATAKAELFVDTMDELKRTFQGVMITIGPLIADNLIPLAENVKSLVIGFREWTQEHPLLTSGLVKAAGALGAFLGVAGPIVIMMPGIVASVQVLAGAGGFIGMAGATGAAGAAFVAMLGPAALVIASLGAIAWSINSVTMAWAEHKAALEVTRETSERISKTQQRTIDLFKEEGIELDEAALKKMTLAERDAELQRIGQEFIKTQEQQTGAQQENIGVTDQQTRLYAALEAGAWGASEAMWELARANAALNDQALQTAAMAQESGISGNPMAMSAGALTAPSATPLAEAAGGGTTVSVTIGSIGADAADTTAIADIISEQIQTQLTAIGV
jgi:hypothetical protein